MSRRILLVEDEPGLVLTLTDRLMSEGYDVESEGDAVRGLAQGSTGNFDLILLDVMNEEAWDVTRRTGYVTFFSRTRNKLWTKGETSGNRLAVRDVLIDCDEDTVLVKAERLGDGNVCHTGERTCFFQRVEGVTIPC